MKTPNQIINIIYTILLVVIILSWWLFGISLWWIVLPTAIWTGLKVLGSIFIHWNFYMRSYCQKKTDQKVIALSFDDGPDEANLPDLLNVLDEFQVKATFFVIGEKAKKHPALIQQISNNGHVIGNHSYTHARFFDLFNLSRMFNELLMTREQIYKITGAKSLIFRPPYGVTNPNVAKTIQRLGFKSIGWSIRSLDTSFSPDKTIERLIKKTHPGGIVLLHDTTSDIVRITRQYLEWLRMQQYSVISLSHLLSIEVYE